jgi:sirohydrochlorin ferrochelatase
VNPVLLAVAHGTKDAEGTAEIQRLIAVVARQRPDLDVRLCWLERSEPLFAEVLAELDGPAVIVPVLLSTGYHVKVDIPSIVGDRPNTVVTAPLGPDARISQVVAERLRSASAATDGPLTGPILVIGAGSSDPAARIELGEVAAQLQSNTAAAVEIGQLTDADPFAAEHVAVANYLLAPGYFNNRLHELAAVEVVADPVGAHPLVAEVIGARYDTGVSVLSELSSRSSRTP